MATGRQATRTSRHSRAPRAAAEPFRFASTPCLRSLGLHEASERLRPVVFRHREAVAEGGDLQYGLIAEEVAAVAPELVAPDLEGRPYSVRYHALPVLLLNEPQEQQRTIEDQHHRIEAQASAALDQRQRIAALTTRLAELERHLAVPPEESDR